MTKRPQHDPRLVRLFTEAMAYQASGNLKGALIVYKQVQSKFPSFADAWTNASVVLYELGRDNEALEMAIRAVELRPQCQHANSALASAQQRLGRIDEAAAHFLKAIECDPKHFPALTNLAGIYACKGKFAEALELQNMAIHAQPSHPVLWGNRGHTKMRDLDLAGAEADLNHSLSLDPTNPLARWNLAYVQLLQHRYEEAWPNFRARQFLSEWSGNKQFMNKPHWKGEPLNGRTLLVYTEQGYGDTLQFSRFVPRLSRFGGRVLFSIYKPLERIFKHTAGVDQLIIEGEALPNFDLVVPIMDLPVIFNIGKAALGPLPAPPLPEYEPLPELSRPGFKVGLVWAGNTAHTNDLLRSMSPRIFDELAGLSGIAWYGLQVPPADDPPRLPGFLDMSPRMADFVDTAQIAKQLNLIVTVDTSVAHLAGFLDLPAIVLLAYMPDWRWGLDSDSTPWYPSVTLLRQPAHGDWASVVAMLKERIKLMAGG
jgi:Flp pilus assembly protein TadD